MTPKQYVEIARDVLDAVDKDLIDASTGQFKKQPAYADDLAFARDVEKAYVAHGGTIDPKVQQVIDGVSVLINFVK